MDNLVYMDSIEDIVLTLKSELPIEKSHLFNEIKVTTDNIMVTCPYHSDGRENKPSCGISTVKKQNVEIGTVHCFTCGKVTSINQLVSDCFDINDNGEFGRNWINSNFSVLYGNNRDLGDLERRLSNPEVTYVTKEELLTYKHYHEYMWKRNLVKEIVDLFEVGYDYNYKGQECITFPVKDVNGNVLFIARRAINFKYFNYPAGVVKPVYGLYELIQQNKLNETVYICESILNCLTCWTFGKPAVALNGTGTAYQIETLLKLPTRSFVLALDNDKAGLKASNTLIKYLKPTKILDQVYVSNNRDINDLGKQEFLNLILYSR